MHRFTLWLVVVGLSAGIARAAEPDLADFKTVDTAIKLEKNLSSAAAPQARTGYLGVSVEINDAKQLIVAVVAPESPAEKCGLQSGDRVVSIAGQAVNSPAEVRQCLQSLAPGKQVTLAIERGGAAQELTAQLAATSNPLAAGRQRAIMGVLTEDAEASAGALVQRITDGLPAAKAGIKSGDIIAKINGEPLDSSGRLREKLSTFSPGDMIKLIVKREKEELELEVQLTAEATNNATRDDPFNPSSGRTSQYWRRDAYRLAVIGIEYPDMKHNDKVGVDDWERQFFSEGRYIEENATGQTVYGSVNDYYREQSCGKFRVEGKLIPWVEVSKNREEYLQSTNRTALLVEALDKIIERDGKDALDDFDGVFFLYAGGRVQTNRGGLYWPHRATLNHRGKRWPYFIVQEGGSRMTDISVMCHEFGHMLGLPDLYARPEQPGSEGVSVWCAMSQQSGRGRPQHFSAWCKEKLGWITPAVIDPSVKQKLILAPIEGSARECYKIPLRADGSEYLLLENRRQLGFDKSLPAQGLLIWRVVNNKPVLEESHGIEGPAGPGSNRDAVPYPSRSNNAFTPFTMPSSRAQLGGGLPVHITNIRELSDGRITFYVGYEFE